MMDQLASAGAVAVLNRMLSREQWARDTLVPFAERSARFDAAPFSLTLQITSDGSFAIADATPPAVTIGVSLASLPAAMFDTQAALKDVKLSGDAEFAQALAFVLQNLRPEPEEELSRFIGDAAAQRVVGLMKTSAASWSAIAQSMVDNAAHYVVVENPMVVGRDELEACGVEVNRARDAVDRIEKRVQRLAVA